ncbi:VOC family protein [Acidobacteriota bacterium]
MQEKGKTAVTKTTGLHFATTFSSEDKARSLFGDLFGLTVIKEFSVDENLCGSLFEINQPVKIILFDAGPVAVEVFVSPETAGRSGWFDHLCVQVDDRSSFVERAEGMGLEIRRYVKNGKEIVFLKDWDGNLYEIK